MEFLQKFILRPSAMLALLLSVSTQGFALDVEGTLVGETHWSANDSPIRVTGDLRIHPDAKLDIDPGVMVTFAGPYNFIVEGNLQAVGELGAFITFTAENHSIDSLRWRGIRFINADRDCQLSYCRIEYGWARGVWPEDRGGGIFIEGCSPSITHCEIQNNRADGDGGGIYGWFSTSMISNNLILLNSSGRFGGGIFMDYSSPNILNCTIVLGEATAWGGGVYFGANGDPVIKNCIVVNNNQSNRLDGDRIAPGTVFFKNLGNSHGSSHKVTFSLIESPEQDPYPGSGNIVDDPIFVNSDIDVLDFHLKLDSPCIDAGDPQMSAALEPDILVNRVNMGAYGSTIEATRSLPVIYVNLFENSIALDYDSIKTETQVAQEVRVANHGHYRLLLHDFIFSTDVFFPDSAVNDDDELLPSYQLGPIDPGTRTKFAVQFRPSANLTYNDTLFISSTDSLSPVPFVVLRGTGINPVPEMGDSLVFASSQIGAEHVATMEIANVGDSELRISSVSIQGDGFTSRVIDRNIATDATGLIEFTFAPEIPQVYSAFASVRTNGGNVGLTLIGRGIGPKMIIETEEMFLGYVYTGGDTSRMTFTVANWGDDLLNITDIFSSNDAFSVDLPPSGLAVADSDSVDLTVNFHPATPNEDYEGIIIINSDYPIPDTVSLSGTGMPEPGKYMFGEVSGTWEWNDDSPDYIILDSVHVAPQTYLRIRPGARILFEPGAFLRADGELRAVGLEEDSIYFLPRDLSGTDEARWGGLQLSLNDRTNLSYCVISGATIGMRITESSPLIQYNSISFNADTSGSGGGIYLENSGANIHACNIHDNVARTGGGICVVNSIPSISNCNIHENNADMGGGIYLRFLSSALIQSNLIYKNDGGGVYIDERSAPRLVNNTLVENDGYGITTNIRSMPILVNNIVWGNSDGSLSLGSNSHALVSYCNIEGGTEGSAILDTLPAFVDPFDDLLMSYQLSEESPMIDAGNPEISHRDYYFPPSLGTERNDIGAYGGPLGGGWESPEIEVSVFQNPAFPQWLDIFVVSMDSIVGSPVCSLQVGSGDMLRIPLSTLTPNAFRGSYEASEGGEIFITVDAEIGSDHHKVGRTYILTLLTSSPEGGYVSMVGVNGVLIIPEGSLDKNLTLLTGFESKPIKAEADRFYLSPEFFIWGMDTPLESPAELRIDIDLESWDEEAISHVGLMRRSGNGWTSLASEYYNGVLTTKIKRGGKFVMVWDSRLLDGSSEIVPKVPDLLTAYPNPFNQKVTIEFELFTAGELLLEIYDLGGRRVATLAEGFWGEGKHREVWRGADDNGNDLSSGLYWARMTSSSGNYSTKLLLLR